MKKNTLRRRLCSLCLGAALLVGSAVPAMAAGTGASEDVERGVLTYTQLIAPQYEDADTFGEGLAAVKQNGKWGYVDETGKLVIPCKYDLAYGFNEGYALVATIETVKEDGNEYDVYAFGSVDKTGKFTPFYEKVMYDLSWGEQLGTKGDLVRMVTEIDFFNESYPYMYYNGYILLNGSLIGLDGMPLQSPNGYYYFDGQMTEGLAAAWPEAEARVVYLDKDGKVVLETDMAYTDYRPFNQDLAVFGGDNFDADGNWIGNIYGFIDRNGKVVIEPSFTNFYVSGYNASYTVFDEMGRAAVEKNGKWGAIDKTGATKIPFEYGELHLSFEGRIAFLQNGKWGFLDSVTLEPVIAAQYDQVTGFRGGIAVAATGSTAKLIDRQGNAIDGATKIAASAYFQTDADGSVSIRNPGDIVTIQQGNKYGFGKVEYIPEMPTADEMSSWAYEEVCAAIDAGLVPVELQNLYQQNITRNDFADVIVEAMQAISGKDVDTLVKDATGKTLDAAYAAYPFVDSTNRSVIAANALGVISGYGNGTFLPNNRITRQEAASMLMRAAKALGAKTDSASGADFADTAAIAAWAQPGVNYVYEAGVMAGTGANQFSPTANYTREQTYMTVYRLLLALTR